MSSMNRVNSFKVLYRRLKIKAPCENTKCKTYERGILFSVTFHLKTMKTYSLEETDAKMNVYMCPLESSKTVKLIIFFPDKQGFLMT